MKTDVSRDINDYNQCPDQKIVLYVFKTGPVKFKNKHRNVPNTQNFVLTNSI